MSFWNIFGIFATSNKGETITKVSENVRVSSNGVTYTTFDGVTTGSDGSTFVQMGNMSSDGSVRLDSSSATGRGALFNNPGVDDFSSSSQGRKDEFGFGSDPW